MKGGEVRIHKNEQIHNLLCGKQQKIGVPHLNQNGQQVQNQGVNDQIDFSKYPFPDPIEPMHANTMNTEQSAREKSSRMHSVPQKNFNKIRQEESVLEHIGNYLSVYETNSQRKSVLLHQELEEHYLQPIARKLVKKVNGPEYSSYLQKRNRAVSAFDKQTHTKDTFLKALPEIPMISFDTSDLTDPILKYRKNAQDERRLTEFIAKSTGAWQNPPEYPERDTMNLKKWKILAETRFYKGKTEPGEEPSKGKRIFSQKYKDDLKVEMDFFAEKPPRPPYVERPSWDSRTDHIKFGDN